MNRLLIEFSFNRGRCGTLTFFDSRDGKVCGPYPVAGRSTDSLAAARGNPRRDPTLCFGDTPTGSYRLSQILKSGKGTSLSAAEFGPHGVAVIEAVSGAAATAEANGRFHLLIEGGRRGADGGLRSTTGSLRVANEHLRILIAAIRKAGELRCDVVESETGPKLGSVFDDRSCRDEDPVSLPRGDSGSGVRWAKNPSRRAALRTGAAGAAGLVAMRLSVAFLALEAVESVPALAYGSSPSGSNAPSPNPPPVASNPPATPPAAGTGTVASPTLPQFQDLTSNAADSMTQPPAGTPGARPVQGSNLPDAKATWFHEMNAASKISNPIARNAAVNAANAKYFTSIGQPLPATLAPTSTPNLTPPPPPAGCKSS